MKYKLLRIVQYIVDYNKESILYITNAVRI